MMNQNRVPTTSKERTPAVLGGPEARHAVAALSRRPFCRKGGFPLSAWSDMLASTHLWLLST